MAIGYVYTNPANEINGVLNKLVDQVNKAINQIPTVVPGGSDTQVQYNHQGTFGGIPGFVWSGTDLAIPKITGAGLLFSDSTTMTSAYNSTAWKVSTNSPFSTMFGFQAGSGTGVDNTTFGYQAGKLLATEHDSTYIGFQAGANAAASFNTGVGATALIFSSGFYNTGVGSNAGAGITSGSGNTGVGFLTLNAVGVSSNNTAVGINALTATTTGYNTAVGGNILVGLSSGGQVTALGFGAGYYSGTTVGGQISTNKVTTASYGTYLGFQASPSSTTARDYQTVIGAGALGYDAGNTVTLGLIGTDTPYMGPAVVGMKTVTTYYIVSTLPAASAALAGARAYVTDALASPVFSAAAVGGGSLAIPVYCDGTVWRNG